MALDLPVYTKTVWAAEMPITADRMNKLEDTVKVNRDALINHDQAIDSIDTRINDRINVVTTGIAANAQLGAEAKAEIAQATTGHTPVYTSLDARFQALDDALGYVQVDGKSTAAFYAGNSVSTVITLMQNSMSNVLTEIQNARDDGVTNVRYTSLALHLLNIDQQINLLHANVADINNAAGTGKTLAERIVQLQLLQNEIDAAHREVQSGQAADTLAKRFTDLDTQISTLFSNVGNLSDNKVNVADIINDLIHTDTNKPLSANMGKTLRDLIGGTYDSTNTVTAAITSAASTAEANAKAYADQKDLDAHISEINAAHRDGSDTLDARFDDIETEINTAHRDLGTDPETEEVIVDSLNKRFLDAEADIAALQTEVAATHTENANSLNTRLTAIETNAAAIASDLHAIANELAMLDDQDAIKDTNTKIDNLEADIQSFARELAMARDDNGRLVETSTRVDTIEGEITSAHRTNEDTLDARFDSIEAAISHAAGDNDAGGLTERVAVLENTTATQQSVSDLAGRVSTLESQPKSATTVIEADRITYDAATGAPTIYTNSTKTIPITPSTDVDYLLQKEDKYYYWKYIQTGSSPDTFEWALISGGGSDGGNSSGFDMVAADYDALTTEDVAVNTDYYVAREDGIHHYRYIPNTTGEGLREIEIGQIVDLNKIKRYNIGLSEEGEGDNAVTYLNLYQYDYADINNTDTEEKSYFNRVALPKGGGGAAAGGVRKRLTRIGDQQIQKIVGSTILLQVFYSYWTTNVNEQNQVEPEESSAGTFVLKSGNTVIETGTIPSGAFGETVDGFKEGTNGYYQFDVTKYCKAGNTSFELTVTTNGEPQGKDWVVNLVDLRLESDAPLTQLIDSTESFSFPYTPFGALTKKLFVKVDGVALVPEGTTLVATTSGRTAYYTIPAQEHGVHKIEMYLTASIGGVPQTTESLIREYIWYDVDNEDTPVLIASPLDGQTVTAQQYSTIEIPYQIYKKGASTIDVYYYLNDSEQPYDHVVLDGVNTGTFSYVIANENDSKITIKVDEETVTVNLDVTPLNINVSPVAGAIIDFDPTSLTNNSANRLPSWTVGSGSNTATYNITTSDNFNWSNDISGGGYKEDEDGKCFVIKAGSYIDLNYPLFKRGLHTPANANSTVFDRGAEIKVIFKTKAVRNIDAIWLSNTGSLTEKTVGIQLGAHSGWLKTDKAASSNQDAATSEYPKWSADGTYQINDVVIYKDTIYKCIKTIVDDPETEDDETKMNPKDASSFWLSMGKVETEILATNSYLYMPYSEEDKIELDININKYDAAAKNNFIMSYEDGVPSKVYSYTYGSGGDGLYHDNTIRIGSNDCDVYIYRLRIYNQSLDTEDILQNFIADGRDIGEKVARHDRNCIYWDSQQEQYFISASQTASLDPIKFAERVPNVKVLMLETPVFTTGKKNFVQNSTLRCIHAKGEEGVEYDYPSRGDADNWFFQGGFHAGQGTTSDNYGQSARNVDFLFITDGVNYPTKKKNMSGYTPSSDYVSSVLVGEDASQWIEDTNSPGIYHWAPAREANENEICHNWKGDDCKVSLTATSVPNNYFNLKVNVASSENVNNALFQKRYDDFIDGIYHSPATEAQKAKHGSNYANANSIKVKNSMEFVPAVLFVRETADDLSTHTEFKDKEWHFYALGNIGDSKKTDYTRAYDPNDMNEFTCENSDNNTNNGQFQSGVFTYNGHRAIETPYNAYDAEKTYEAGAITVNEGTIQVYDGTTWTAASLIGWNDEESPYFAPYTAPNPMEYLYPISSSEWNVQVLDPLADTKLFADKIVHLNYKHYALDVEEFDGDHSFEFRYACCGDYRDGDLINKTAGQDDDAQFDLNHGVVLAFYEWLITATEEQYVAEAEQWFVKPAMEFFYAYTHYYTMMDNRAKNTFWHFAKTGTHHAVSRPVKALLHVYDELKNGAYEPTEDTEIDPEKTYYTQYAFDLWAYDMDTAAGIDNNGALVFPYGKEDTDYRTEGDALSGYAFNGAGSIFWRRIRTTFADEIRDVMSRADSKCFNAENLINEFDRFQDCFPEEVWRLDIERKYIRTFTGLSMDNSVTVGKQNPRFLTSMMQGRKKYQRRQWIRDQGVYFNSKYRLSDITDNSNTIEFNCTTPATTDGIAVMPDYHLQLIPYQDMYLNVQVGNGNYQPQIRAKAGQTYVYDLKDPRTTPGNYQETRIYISGANSLSGIGNLAPMYPYSFDLRALNHIKTLDIGTDNANYINTKFTELKLPDNIPLLERLNLKNCHSVSGTISLDNANNIREVTAEGTAITGISLPDYTNIETLHIPSTMTTLNLYGARFLSDFKVINSAGNVDYGALFKLYVYDSDYSEDVDWIDIATAIISKRSLETEISLLKLSTATIGNIQTLEPLNEFKTELEDAGNDLILGGTITVTGDWSEIERDNYMTVWPQLNLLVNEDNKQNKYKVTYEHDDGTILATLYIDEGSAAPDIYSTGVLSQMPTKPQTERESYIFGSRDDFTSEYVEYSGWHLSSSSQPISQTGLPYVFSNLRIITYFRAVPRTYQIKWYLDKEPDGRLVKTSPGLVAYGGGYDQEAPTVQEIHAANFETCSISFNGAYVTYKIFNGWEKLPTNINPTAADTYYAIHANWIEGKNISINTLFADTSNLSIEQLAVLSAMDGSMKDAYNISDKIETGVNRMVCTMGADSIVEGTELVSTPLRTDGANFRPYATTIQPLRTDNDAFTLAIDFCFNEEMTESITTNYSTLVSCYYSDISSGIKNGFGLFYGKAGNTISGPRVGFGDMYNAASQSVEIGSSTTLGMRNMVVLRHPANEPTLYVYYGLNGSNVASEVAVYPINWQNYNSDAYINIGQLGSGADSTDGAARQVSNGKGTIYWMKYWPEDLGQGECKRLANWPHEQITYGLSYLSDNATTSVRAIGNTAKGSINLASLSTLAYGTYYQGRVQTDGFGWGSSSLDTIMNTRVVGGLPIALQSILCKDETAYTIGSMVNDPQMGITYSLSNSGGITRDYVRPYSLAHVLTNDSVYKNAEESNATAPLPWLDLDNIIVYDYQANGWTVNNSNSSDFMHYLNLRFPNKAISWGEGNYRMRVFRELNSSTVVPSSTTVADSIYIKTNELRSGDIYVMEKAGSTYTYIFVTTAEMQALGLQPASTTFDARLGASTQGAPTGRWLEADEYWTRSVIVNNGFNFGYVLKKAGVNNNTTNQVDSRGLKFSQILTI